MYCADNPILNVDPDGGVTEVYDRNDGSVDRNVRERDEKMARESDTKERRERHEREANDREKTAKATKLPLVAAAVAVAVPAELPVIAAAVAVVATIVLADEAAKLIMSLAENIGKQIHKDHKHFDKKTGKYEQPHVHDLTKHTDPKTGKERTVRGPGRATEPGELDAD